MVAPELRRQVINVYKGMIAWFSQVLLVAESSLRLAKNFFG